eukprot:144767-Prymnesium_polylepis.3
MQHESRWLGIESRLDLAYRVGAAKSASSRSEVSSDSRSSSWVRHIESPNSDALAFVASRCGSATPNIDVMTKSQRCANAPVCFSNGSES